MVRFVASIEQPADPVMDFIMCSLSAVTDTHIMHWTTDRYSQHQALGEFYDGLSDLIDEWAEAFMGKAGVLTKFPTQCSIMDGDPIVYLRAYLVKVETYRRMAGFPQDTALQNIVDEIVALTQTTLYKLTRLN
jgi:hypothetical protein